MELTNDPLVRLFEAWRSEIDSAPFSHEGECERIVSALLSSAGTSAEPGSCLEPPG